MIETFANIGTAFGLSSSAGLNAYLPLLMVSLTAKYTDLIELSEPWDVMTSWWVIGTLVVLMLIELTVDKIPGVDTVNDIVQTVGRPAAGAVLFAANSGVIGEMNPVLACVAGLLLAGSVHAVKTVTRPAVTGITAGTGNWAVSLAEDALAVLGTILAILVPVLMVGLVILFLTFGLVWYLRRRRLATTHVNV